MRIFINSITSHNYAYLQIYNQLHILQFLPTLVMNIFLDTYSSFYINNNSSYNVRIDNIKIKWKCKMELKTHDSSPSQ